MTGADWKSVAGPSSTPALISTIERDVSYNRVVAAPTLAEGGGWSPL
jgi:hypothetical protein